MDEVEVPGEDEHDKVEGVKAAENEVVSVS